MISILKIKDENFVKLEEATNGCWIHAIDPTNEEIEQIASLGIPQDFVTYPLDLDERARYEREDDGKILIVIRIPYSQGEKADIPYFTIPLGIILTEKHLFTICRKENDIMAEFRSGRVRNLSTAKHNRFLLRILLATASKYLTYLREINKMVDGLEDKLQVSMRNHEMMELLKYQKCLVYFTSSLKANELMLERLQRSQLFHMYPDDEDLLEDVITENQQAIEMTNISSNILTSMMDAFASIISNNMNIVMKFLASVTVVLSIPTIVTSYFGMNVPIPYADHPMAYLGIIGFFVAICLAIVWIFTKRDWF